MELDVVRGHGPIPGRRIARPIRRPGRPRAPVSSGHVGVHLPGIPLQRARHLRIADASVATGVPRARRARRHHANARAGQRASRAAGLSPITAAVSLRAGLQEEGPAPAGQEALIVVARGDAPVSAPIPSQRARSSRKRRFLRSRGDVWPRGARFSPAADELARPISKANGGRRCRRRRGDERPVGRKMFCTTPRWSRASPSIDSGMGQRQAVGLVNR
jgi:hypothetical protein